MQLPRFQLTIRRMMIAVAIVGVAIAAAEMLRRHDYFRGRYSFHAVTAEKREASGDIPAAQFHRRRAYEFAHAARYPWLPVAPDPPEPE